MSWLDLRGHLRLAGPGLFVDSNVPAPAGRGPERRALGGRVGVELAALLLLDPTERIGVRAAAAMLSRAPSRSRIRAVPGGRDVDIDDVRLVGDLLLAALDR